MGLMNFFTRKSLEWTYFCKFVLMMLNSAIYIQQVNFCLNAWFTNAVNSILVGTSITSFSVFCSQVQGASCFGPQPLNCKFCSEPFRWIMQISFIKRALFQSCNKQLNKTQRNNLFNTSWQSCAVRVNNKQHAVPLHLYFTCNKF